MSKKGISLVVLAAGMGSRYGGLKQLDALGPSGETILDYSVYDAVEAGFSKVVFVIRDFFAEDFKTKVGNQFRDKIDVRYVFQPVNPSLDFAKDLPEREKPWGTNHAVLVCKDEIDEPFCVINADDYYGKSGFIKMAEFLRNEVSPELYSMIGYQLKNTLSESGYVNRGVCKLNGEYLVDVIETLKIKRDSDGMVYSHDSDGNRLNQIDEDSFVSMNFWGFDATYFDFLERGFERFVQENHDNPKAEYYIPNLVDEMIKSDTAKCLVISSEDNWYGVTYKEDAQEVKDNFAKLVEEGKYPSPLWI